MKFDEYQKDIYRAIPEHTSEKDEILHWLIGIAEEVGETISVIKHHFYGGEELNYEELAKEIGDILWYTAAFCTACHVNMDTIAEINVEKLKHRFPDDFDNNRSAERHDLDKKFSETQIYKDLLRRLSW